MNAQLQLAYDENCPFCRWYTKQFVKHHFLHEEGRVPFDRLQLDASIQFDSELAKNKIALIDTNTKEITYGVDSLLKILGVRLPIIGKIGKLPIIYPLLQLLYSFISYNRKVIAPSNICQTNCNCSPSVSWTWRILFVVFVTLGSHAIVSSFFNSHLLDYKVMRPVPEFVLFLAQIGFQGIAFLLFKQRNFYDYLGNLVFTSFLGALILLVFHFGLNLLQLFQFDTSLLAPICFGIVVCFLFFEHQRRLKLHGWSGKLTYSWLVFRVLIFPLVFQF